MLRSPRSTPHAHDPRRARRAKLATAVLLALSAHAGPAAAQRRGIDAHADPGLVLGAKLGAGIGAPLSDFGATPIAELELGYLLPFGEPIGRAFELFVAGSYSAPSLSGQSSTSDPRLPGDGLLHYHVQQRLFTATGGLLFRVPLPTRAFSPYAALGYRAYLIDSDVRGRVGSSAVGTNREQGFEHGLEAALGVDVYLGPGALLAELQLGYAPRHAFVLRDTNLGALQLMLGYRFMFGGPSQAAASAPEPAAPDPPPTAAEEIETAPPPSAVAAEPLPEPAAAPPPAAALKTGQIRGNVRSFSGGSVRASVLVHPGDLKAQADADGQFSIDLPPGHYTVHLRAHGYKSQDRKVVVNEDGVTVLNVELGKK